MAPTTSHPAQRPRSFLARLRRPSAPSPGSPLSQAQHLPRKAPSDDDIALSRVAGRQRGDVAGEPGDTGKEGLGEEDDWERIKTLPRIRLEPPDDEGEPVTLYPPPRPRLPLLSIPARPTSPPMMTAADPSSRSYAEHLFFSDHSPSAPDLPSSPPRSPPRHFRNDRQEHQWKNMSQGFVVPPPKFSRGRGGVVMPRKKGDVHEEGMRRWSRSVDSLPLGPTLRDDEQRLKRVSRVLEEDEVGAAFAQEGRQPQGLQGAESALAADGSQSASSTLVQRPLSQEAESQDEQSSSGAADALPTTPSVLAPGGEDILATTSAVASPSPSPIEPAGQSPESSDLGAVPTASPQTERRKSRALSLTSALAALRPEHHDSSSSIPITALPPLPPLPSNSGPIRKQKSLKQFFFASDAAPAPAPVPALPDTPGKRGLLGRRSRSKPSLKIDVHGPRTENGPSSSSSTSGRSDAYPETPTSAVSVRSSQEGNRQKGGLGLSKRFSLSNMSGAFKRSAGGGGGGAGGGKGKQVAAVPQVPDLPEVYKREKHRVARKGSKGSEKTAGGEPTAKEMSVEEAETEGKKSHEAAEEAAESTATEDLAGGTTGPMFASSLPRTSSCSGPDSDTQVDAIAMITHDRPPIDADSSLTAADVEPDTEADDDDDEGEGEDDPAHAQLMHISPRTRLDPSSSSSLRNFLGTAPVKHEVEVQWSRGAGSESRKSIEAVLVLGPLLAELIHTSPTPRASHYDEGETTGEQGGGRAPRRRGSGSSEEDEEEDELVTPTGELCKEHNPLSPPPLDYHPDQEQETEPNLPAMSSTKFILVETPPPGPAYTLPNDLPTNPGRFGSPEMVLKRLLSSSSSSSENRSKAKGGAKGRTSGEESREGQGEGVPEKEMEKGWSSLVGSEVQLRSLHFEGLGLDFGGEWTEEDGVRAEGVGVA